MPETKPDRQSTRIASIDWMRGIVMVLMVVDHASMAFNGYHFSKNSAMYAGASTIQVPDLVLLTRWVTHLCAPTFVFLAGTALAISVEKKIQKGASAWEIDKGMLIRGAIIALLDVTLISLGSGRWTLQVLIAIGLSMILMVPLRRLSTSALLAIGLGWFLAGEWITGLVWTPPGSSSPVNALLFAVYGTENMVIKYPVIPWLAMMVVGWVFGRHIVRYAAGAAQWSPRTVMLLWGVIGLIVFYVVRLSRVYGDMFLVRAGDTWQQWLHISKYPPSLSFAALEIGLMCLILYGLMLIEPKVRVRKNGFLLVLGQTAMFFYLVHRLVLEVPATYFGLRGFGDLTTAYLTTAVLLPILYLMSRWYRSVKAKYPTSVLKYF